MGLPDGRISGQYYTCYIAGLLSDTNRSVHGLSGVSDVGWVCVFKFLVGYAGSGTGVQFLDQTLMQKTRTGKCSLIGCYIYENSIIFLIVAPTLAEYNRTNTDEAVQFFVSHMIWFPHRGIIDTRSYDRGLGCVIGSIIWWFDSVWGCQTLTHVHL